MAFALKSLSLAFLLLLSLLLLLQLSSDCLSNGGNNLSSVASLKDIQNRKLLVVINGHEAKSTVLKTREKEKNEKNGEEVEEGWELRTAPLGPDPLHHNGANPKKPQTP